MAPEGPFPHCDFVNWQNCKSSPNLTKNVHYLKWYWLLLGYSESTYEIPTSYAQTADF